MDAMWDTKWASVIKEARFLGECRPKEYVIKQTINKKKHLHTVKNECMKAR
jgi:hypothetical protein